MRIKDLHRIHVGDSLEATFSGKLKLPGVNMAQLVAEYARHTPLQPTYQRLREAGEKHFRQTTTSEQGLRNILSALAAWMKHFGFRDRDLVGTEFDVEFERYTRDYREALKIEGKAERTIQDRLAYIARWKDQVHAVAENAELPEPFNEALSEAMARRQMSLTQLSRYSGIGHSNLAAWARGETRPGRNVAAQMKKLEQALRLPADTLASRLGFVIKRRQVTEAAKANKLEMTSYSARRSQQFKREFRLNYLIRVPEQMRAEWRELTTHKTSTLREHASSNDVWRIKPRDKVGDKPSWASLLENGDVVPAADAAWGYLSRYYSWLALDVAHGGAGIATERVSTLAWILNQELVMKFLAWMQRRSNNKLHGGIPSFLQYAAMLVRPNTGWLYLNESLALRIDAAARSSCLGFEPAGLDLTELTSAWRKRCEQVWKLYYDRARFLSTHKSLTKARDPKEPIQDILAEQRPLSIVIDMLATLKRNPPSCIQTKRYAVWTRDVLLLAWLTANPLRVNHFATMTYRRDNTGNVYRVADGDWHYRCELTDFKNSPARYMNTPDGKYDVKLPGYVGDAIEHYLKEGRPYLAGANDNDFFLLPEKFANQTDYDRAGVPIPVMRDRWNAEAISTRVRLVTRALRDGKPGFGPHAFRHIVATDYLKRFPGAYKLVADLLCDQLQTVISEYGHTSAQDGLNIHYTAAEAEYAAAMGGKP